MSGFIQVIHRGSALVASLIAIAALMPPQAQAAQPNGIVPYQFIAKMYTEALGRAPDPAGWQSWVNTFMEDGCQVSTLQSVATTFYTVQEFTGLYSSDTSNQAQLIALYRGALNRDPNPADLGIWLNNMKNGTTWSQVVSGILGSQEFTNLEPTICSATQPDYGFAGYGPAPYDPTAFAANINYSPSGPNPSLLPACSCAPCYTSSLNPGSPDTGQLQTFVNNHGGSTVYLAQDQTIWLTSKLTLPNNTTLETCGLSQGPGGGLPYAQMARLARDFGGAGVDLIDIYNGSPTGISLEWLWIDGQRNYWGWTNPSNFNIQAAGGNDNISYNRVSEAQGNMLIGVAPGSPGAACTMQMKYNLLTAYTSDQQQPLPNAVSDGIDDYCEDATIANNWIIDAADTGILAFGMNGINQYSQIENNTIVQAGNNSNAIICLDQNTQTGGGGHAVSFVSGGNKMTMSGNVFWTSPATTTAYGICAGTAEWNMPNAPPYNTSNGGVFTNNGTPSSNVSFTNHPPLTVSAREGIAVTYGTYGVDIDNTPVATNVVNFIAGQGGSTYVSSNCPGGAVIADSSVVGQSTYPTATYTVAFSDCQSSSAEANNYQLADPTWASGTVWKGWSVGVGNGHGATTDATVQDTWNGSQFTGNTNNNNPPYSYNEPYELYITDAGQSYWVSVYQTVYGLPAGEPYTITAAEASSGGLSGSGSYLAVFDPINNPGSPICVQYTTSSSWTTLTCTGTVPNNSNGSGELSVQVSSGPGTGNGQPAGTWVAFDDVTLTVNGQRYY